QIDNPRSRNPDVTLLVQMPCRNGCTRLSGSRSACSSANTEWADFLHESGPVVCNRPPDQKKRGKECESLPCPLHGGHRKSPLNTKELDLCEPVERQSAQRKHRHQFRSG